MIHIQEARVLLADAVDTQGPDFVYNPDGRYAFDCYYLPVGDSHTGCLIGVALQLSKAISTEDLLKRNSSNVYELAKYYPELLSERAATYFTQAQSAQDSGKTWGEALRLAEVWYTSQ